MASGNLNVSRPLGGRLVARLARTRFVRTAMEGEAADLGALRGKPSPAVILGVALIGFSYIIGWPAVALLGLLAAHFQRMAIVVVGGPLVYGLSHLVFMLGMYFAGNHYAPIFLRCAARAVMRKLLARYPSAAPGFSET
ncbi:MAG TPA: hypothetical protein VI078_15145 [bacterium]